MPNCIVKSCSFSWRTRRTQTDEVILHAFPRDRDRIRKWLEQLNVPREDLEYFLERIATSGKGIYRICSRHFKDTDYEIRGPHKVLRSTAYPTLHLENIFERPSTTSSTINRVDVEHDYYKRLRTGQTYTSNNSATEPSKTGSDSTFSFTGTSPTTSNFIQCSVSQTTECDLEETPYVDCILDKSNASGDLPTEFSSDIPISHTQKSKNKHCKICSHGLLLSRKPKAKKRHESTDVEMKNFTVSIGTQCSLVDLPPLSLLPIIDSSFVEVAASGTCTEDIFHYSLVQDTSPEPTSDPHAVKENIGNQAKCRYENINILELSPTPRIKQEVIVSSCDYISNINTSLNPQNSKSEKDPSYRSSHEDDRFKLEQLEDEEFHINCADPDLSFIYLPPDIGHSKMAKKKTFLVFEQCLDQLLLSSRCMRDIQCNGRISGLRKYMVGSALVVYAECNYKHKFKLWTSQPFVRHIPSGNLLISAAILCSGSNFLKMESFFSLLEMASISATTHYNNQKRYLFPTIEHHWYSQRREILEQIGQKSVALLGDHQCDPPGYSAKYCTYALLDAESNCVVDFQVKELQAGKTSASLENIAFVEALNRILSDQVRVKVVTTDGHVSVRKIIKESFPCIKQEFDLWHMAKSVVAKLHAASKKRHCRELSSWVSLAKKHLWWASSTSHHNSILLKEKWLSIIYHSANVHEWTGNTFYHRCSHLPILNDESKGYEWLSPGSTAHQQLKSIVQDSRLLKDLDQLSVFYHSEAIEDFHNMVYKYCSKRHNLFMDAMVARTQLAVMDHNQNISRPQAVIWNPKSTSDPEETLPNHKDFSKTKKVWMVNKRYRSTSQVFVKEIMSDAIDFAAGLRHF
ncbi:uncharacterized protein ACMZJ9_013789 [Mantella aurantiaca]